MLLNLRSLLEDFPVTSSYPNTKFWVAPYVGGASWADHDSVTGPVAGASGGLTFVKTDLIVTAPASDPSLVYNGRASAVFGTAFTTPWVRIDCGVWHDTDAGVIVATGVSSWGNRGSSTDANRVLTQAIAGSQPALITADADFKGPSSAAAPNSISPDGVDDQLHSVGDWSGAPIAQGSVHYIVGRIDYTITSGAYFFDGPASGTSRQAFFNVTGTEQIYAGAQFGTTVEKIPFAKVFIACIVYNGTKSALYIDDMITPVVTGDASTGGLSGETLFNRFASVGADFMKMRIVAKGAFFANESQANRVLMATYLKNKYDPGAFDSRLRLSMKGFWRNFVLTGIQQSVRWSGTESLGTSAGAVLVADADGDAVPIEGNLYGGFRGAQFATNRALETIDLASNYLTNGAGTIAVVANLASAVAHASTFTDPAIVAQRGGNLSMAFSTSGLEGHFQDAGGAKRAVAPCSTGAMHLLLMRWDSTNVQVRVDLGGYFSAAAGANASLALGTLVVGKQPFIAFQPMELLEVRFMPTAISDFDANNLWNEVNARYGLA